MPIHLYVSHLGLPLGDPDVEKSYNPYDAKAYKLLFAFLTKVFRLHTFATQ